MGVPILLGGLSWVQLQKIVGTDDFELPSNSGVRRVFPIAAWRPSEQEIRKLVREKELVAKGFDSPVVSNNNLILSNVGARRVEHWILQFRARICSVH